MNGDAKLSSAETLESELRKELGQFEAAYDAEMIKFLDLQQRIDAAKKLEYQEEVASLERIIAVVQRDRRAIGEQISNKLQELRDVDGPTLEEEYAAALAKATEKTKTKTKTKLMDWLEQRTAAALLRLANKETAPASPSEIGFHDTDTKLDKKKHSELAFYLADFECFALKDDVASMEHPLFSLSKNKDMTLWSWKSADGKKSIEIAPGFYGRATIVDKDILIYCASQILAGINAEQPVSRTVRFIAYDFLTKTKRQTNGGRNSGYERMKAALNRLKGMQITTDIRTGGIRQAEGFGMIDGWGVVGKEEDDPRMTAVQVTLSRWFYNSLTNGEVLTLHTDYFNLRPLERRIYEIARKHVGQQQSWQISIVNLQHKTGSKIARPRQFADELKKIIAGDTLLDYQLQIDGDSVVIKPKPAKKI